MYSKRWADRVLNEYNVSYLIFLQIFIGLRGVWIVIDTIFLAHVLLNYKVEMGFESFYKMGFTLFLIAILKKILFIIIIIISQFKDRDNRIDDLHLH